MIWRFVRLGSYWQKVDHVIEDPIFTKSHSRNLIQLSDIIAYITQRHYRDDPKFRDWFGRLKPKMCRPNGALSGFGIKKFPD